MPACSTATHCACARGQNRSTAIVHMTPHENAIMHRPPMTRVLAVAPPPGGTTTGAGVRWDEALDRRMIGTGVFDPGGGTDVLDTGGAVGVTVRARD